LWLIIFYVTIAAYLLLSEKGQSFARGRSDLMLYTITQGLTLGNFLNAKIFSSLAKKGINRLSDVLPKGNQLYPIFFTAKNPALDKARITRR
jgi:hypothetical protein